MKVLLVDDSGLSRKVQAKVLREVGVSTVLEAKNGLDALKKLEEEEFDVNLMLTDWNMPGMDGITLIQEVRKNPRCRGLPIIVVSGEGEEGRIAKAFSAGATSYVTKPFKKEILARKLTTVQSIAEFDRKQDPGAPAQASGEVLMEGDLERLGFAELVGFLNFSKKTGELIISLDSGEAGVAFRDGDVKDAWIGRFSSEDAFNAIARLPQGHFGFYEGRQPKAERIKQPTLSLLMEAMRTMDEEAAGG